MPEIPSSVPVNGQIQTASADRRQNQGKSFLFLGLKPRILYREGLKPANF